MAENCHVSKNGVSDSDERVTIQVAMKALGVSRKTLYRYIEKGWLTKVKEDGSAYIVADDIRRLIQRRRKESASPPDTQDDTREPLSRPMVTIDRDHYEQMLMRLGQLETQHKYLLEDKAALDGAREEVARLESELRVMTQDIERLRRPWWWRWFK